MTEECAEQSLNPEDEIIFPLLAGYGWTVLKAPASGPAPPLIL